MIWFFNMFIYWLSIFFVAPLKNFEILWILIPIYINLFFAEFFQEKRGTDLGNATTNGAVILWVGIDWFRFIFRNYEGFSFLFFIKIFLCLITLGYAIWIIYEGVKGKSIVKYIGRIRVVSYFMLVFSPVIYQLIKPELKYIIAIIMFFPLYYYFFELIDSIIPDPKSITEKSGSEHIENTTSSSLQPNTTSSQNSAFQGKDDLNF